MTSLKTDKIILGHNPLFGVDHLSQEKGNQKELKFSDKNLLKDVLLYAKSLGVNAMMMSTHPRSEMVAEIIRNDSELSDMAIYPLLPYIRKYVKKANEKGLLNLALDVIKQTNFKQKVSMALSGGKSLLKKDINEMVKVGVDLESSIFNGLNNKAYFLHDAITDLALGLGAESSLEIFRDHVEKKYGVKAGFITKNVPNFREKVEKMGWNDYLVMASINSSGFYVNPSMDGAVTEINRPGMQFIAMNTLAGGALKPDEAYRFLGENTNVKSIVVGMSKKEHITETVGLINKYIS